MKYRLSLAVALITLGFGAPSMAEPKTAQDAIAANSALVVEKIGKLSDKPFGYDAASVEFIDSYIERNRQQWMAGGIDERLTQVLASFVGDAMIAEYGGEWTKTDVGIGVELAPEFFVYPFAKVRKHITNGAEDSTFSFFKTTGDLLAAHKAED